MFFFFFFFNDTATTEIYTLSLHDALPIFELPQWRHVIQDPERSPVSTHHNVVVVNDEIADGGDRKSTRLNSSHSQISYAVFCLKKKKNKYDIYEDANRCNRYESTTHSQTV